MKIAITGATGFVGRHLARSLSYQGHQLELIVRGVDGRDRTVRRIHGARFHAASVTTWDVEVDPNDQMQIWRKPEQTPVTIAAKKSYLGRVYLDWTRYPLTETEPLADGGYVVKFKDLRFDYPEMRRRRSVLEATVILDSKLDVLGEKFGK